MAKNNINYKRRIARIKARISKAQLPQALLLSSAPVRMRTRDQAEHYRQDSDYFYLTGDLHADRALFISSNEKKPLLFAPKVDPHKVVWEGAPDDPSDTAKRIGAELVVTDSAASDIKNRLKNIRELYFQNNPGSLSWRVARGLMELSSHLRGNLPVTFHHSDALLEELRLFKEPAEVEWIEEAAHITYQSIASTLPLVWPGSDEGEIAAALEYNFRVHGAEPAFPTIAGSGASAATLHYHRLDKTLKKNEMLLLDCGAQYQMYAADVTRMFPVGGVFQGPQADLYDVVLSAQRAAIKKVRHNVKIAAVYQAAARELTIGLKDLGVLRGRISGLLKKAAYKQYFPHGIGHSLGLDVHDVGNLRGNTEAVLKQGMVFTVEPGLYFPKRAGKLPACGVRIEDDVLVTRTGAKVLTAMIPKEAREVERLMAY